MIVKTLKFHPDARIPEKAYDKDFCYDVYATSEEEIAANVWRYGLGLGFQIERGNEVLIQKEIERVSNVKVGANEKVQALLKEYDSIPLNTGVTLAELIRRPELDYDKLAPIDTERVELPADVCEQVSILIKYDGYIERQIKQVEKYKKLEKKKLAKRVLFVIKLCISKQYKRHSI